jgi:VanZ family protein
VSPRARLVLWAPVALLLAFEFWLSSQSNLPGPGDFGIEIPQFDKLEHAGYFCLMGVLALRAARFGERWTARTTIALVVLGGFLVGALDEFHQSFIPARDADLLDVAADTLGAGFAALAGERLLVALGLDGTIR